MNIFEVSLFASHLDNLGLDHLKAHNQIRNHLVAAPDPSFELLDARQLNPIERQGVDMSTTASENFIARSGTTQDIDVADCYAVIHVYGWVNSSGRLVGVSRISSERSVVLRNLLCTSGVFTVEVITLSLEASCC